MINSVAANSVLRAFGRMTSDDIIDDADDVMTNLDLS